MRDNIMTIPKWHWTNQSHSQEIKKRISKTFIKKGQHLSFETEFKKGNVPHNKLGDVALSGKERAKRNRENNPINHKVSNTIQQHKKRGYIINISFEELLEIAKNTINCPICNTKLDWKYGTGRNNNSPALDRKDNTNELNKNNVWYLCDKCNRHKNDATIDELIAWCKKVIDMFGGDYLGK